MDTTVSGAKMRDLRNDWKSVHFEDRNFRVHARDISLLGAIAKVVMGERLLKELNNDDKEVALELAFTISNRGTVRHSVTPMKLMVWKEENPKLATLRKGALETVEQYLTAATAATNRAENARAFLETQGMDADKYEEAALQNGFAYANTLIATGRFRLVELGKTFVMSDAR